MDAHETCVKVWVDDPPRPEWPNEGRRAVGTVGNRDMLGRTYGRILDLSFGCGSFSRQAWPQDPFKRVRLEKWCTTHLK